MSVLCEVSDRSIIEKESEYKDYLATMRKKNDKSLYKKYTINNINLDEVDKILNDYIITHNKKFDLYFIICEFKIEFDNNSTTSIETNYFYNIEANNIKSYLLYYSDCFSLQGYNFYNINQTTINSNHDRCNITHREYLKLPMPATERKINLNIDKNPQMIHSLDRNKNHLLIRNNSHITFNN